jgi:hypothetical protein
MVASIFVSLALKTEEGHATKNHASASDHARLTIVYVMPSTNRSFRRTDRLAEIRLPVRTIAILVTLCLQIAPNASQADSGPKVEVRDLGEGLYELSVVLPGTDDPAQGHAALAPTAERICGQRAVVMGRYTFEGQAPIAGTVTGTASVTFRQQVECRAPDEMAPAPESPVPPAPATPPTMQDEADVRSRTLAYLAAKDRGAFDEAHRMLSPATAKLMTVESWRAPRAAFNAQTQGDPRPQVLRITFYDDPAEAPSPGRYAAADYRTEFQNQALYCGFVVWLRQADGSYLIVREEEGNLTAESASQIAPGERTATLTAIGCRD